MIVKLLLLGGLCALACRSVMAADVAYGDARTSVTEVMAGAAMPAAATAGSLLDIPVKKIDGTPAALSEHKGKAILVVNTASKCGFTPQYEGLEALYEKYKDKGLVVVGFPANNFGGQEPGSNLEIAEFCTSKYSVTFPMYEKISVKGDDIHPLYAYLTEPATDPQFAGPIKWNFNKFLIGRDGKIADRFDSKVKPDSPELVAAVDKALGAQ